MPDTAMTDQQFTTWCLWRCAEQAGPLTPQDRRRAARIAGDRENPNEPSYVSLPPWAPRAGVAA